ncbi:MAG: preprotein translocase subunit YajC [Lachnospiraceae bacterium]
MNILLSGDASAEAMAAGGTGGIFLTIVIYAVILGAMWFFLFRPQKKEQKKVAAMIASLETGDCVLTTSGFIGIVIDINEDTVIVEFGNNKNCRIPMEKSAISRVEKAGEA